MLTESSARSNPHQLDLCPRDKETACAKQEDSSSAEQEDKTSAEQKAMASYIYNEMRRACVEMKSSFTTISEIVTIPVTPDAPNIILDHAETVIKELKELSFVQVEGFQATSDNKQIKLTTELESRSLGSIDSGFSQTCSTSETLSLASRGETASTVSMAGSIGTFQGSRKTFDEYAHVDKISEISQLETKE